MQAMAVTGQQSYEAGNSRIGRCTPVGVDIKLGKAEWLPEYHIPWTMNDRMHGRPAKPAQHLWQSRYNSYVYRTSGYESQERITFSRKHGRRYGFEKTAATSKKGEFWASKRPCDV